MDRPSLVRTLLGRQGTGQASLGIRTRRWEATLKEPQPMGTNRGIHAVRQATGSQMPTIPTASGQGISKERPAIQHSRPATHPSSSLATRMRSQAQLTHTGSGLAMERPGIRKHRYPAIPKDRRAMGSHPPWIHMGSGQAIPRGRPPIRHILMALQATARCRPATPMDSEPGIRRVNHHLLTHMDSLRATHLYQQDMGNRRKASTRAIHKCRPMGRLRLQELTGNSLGTRPELQATGSHPTARRDTEECQATGLRPDIPRGTCRPPAECTARCPVMEAMRRCPDSPPARCPRGRARRTLRRLRRGAGRTQRIRASVAEKAEAAAATGTAAATAAPAAAAAAEPSRLQTRRAERLRAAAGAHRRREEQRRQQPAQA